MYKTTRRKDLWNSLS